MSIESYVENILNSPDAIFQKIVSKIIQKSDKRAKIELIRQYIEVDEILFSAIKSILNDLKLEENRISKLLYRYLNIELVKNKKREQLIILGREFKSQYSRLKKEQNRVDTHILNIIQGLDNLKLLKESLDKRRDTLYTDREINKIDAFIKKLSVKIVELSEYQDTLIQKSINLSDTERLYLNLYREIPRYYELQEESRANLFTSPKKQKKFSWS